jgi:diguanylate cyclase (GGDEF)-like protein
MDDATNRDNFWLRVRAMLRRNPVAGKMLDGSAATAQRRPNSNRLIDEELRRAWSFAGERKVSMCVLMLEIDCHAEYFSVYGRDAAEDAMDCLERTIAGFLTRENDSYVRQGQAGLVLVLPDMPVLMGRELAKKITLAVRREGLANKESHAGVVTMGMGLAVVNPQEPYDRAVLEEAKIALRKAQRRGLAKLEVSDLRVMEAQKQAMAA